MNTGYVKVVKADKSFGFIRAADKKEYFFHKDDYQGNWEELVKDFDGKIKIDVIFEPKQGLKGPRAIEITRVE